MIRLLFLAAAMATAQEPSAPTFRSGIELIQVSVIAQDKHGKPVPDLTREDFQLFDNGAPRQIRLFVAEKPGPPPPESKTPGLFTNQVAPDGSRRGYLVILIDSLFTDFGDPDKGAGSSFARLQTLRMLRSTPAGDRVAIYALERSLRVICEFTTDRDLLVRQLGRWKPSVYTPGTGNDILQASMGVWDDHRGDAPQKAAAETVIAHSQVRASSLENSMILIADHLATIPGRKNLILLGRHWTIGPRPLQKFKDANVAIYPIDVNGPMLAPPSMLSMAQQTGGVAYYGRNDVNAAIREAMDDGRISYTLGFYQVR
jgi:VWFA-related protein